MPDAADRLPDRPIRKRAARGAPSSDLIFSASVAGNAEVFPQVLPLHAPQGSSVADVTYGQGTFWKHVPAEDDVVLASGIGQLKRVRFIP
ncbi:hypothetical protein Isop_3627 [Isosphaera pallida ATCC 43644]|uniref:Uncharacterized protein n=1 Tax=Isosphaera pallida (strain ATCC 43644 / DSM 9630 / IS1B) TaxID=575540 RepID=E8QYK1_ISOPI|nr:hypothetical protein Isop_3627 [Isosphaera pallida ATCC 43644]